MTPADPMPCLVVDDEPRLRRVLVRLLEAQGFACAEAGSGTEALAQLERAPVPLVISDIRMPQMDGITLLKAIVARWPDTAVVVVTEVAEVDRAAACLQLGALDYIAKPFHLEEVRARVMQALDKRRLILENRMYQRHLEERVREQARRIEELSLERLQALVHALEEKDPYLRGHSMRVAGYAVGIARALGLDGAGLPDGLKGEAIPLEVRIATVADSFDAMTSLRPYRPALSVARALAELEEGKGVQFDARAVEACRAACPDASRLPVTAPAVRPLHLPGPAASD